MVVIPSRTGRFRPRRTIPRPQVTTSRRQPTTRGSRSYVGGGPTPTRPPSTSPKPTAPTPVAQPALQAKLDAVRLPTATANRASAREQYGFTISDINRQLRDLALGYGGAANASQYGYAAGADPRDLGSDTVSDISVTQNDPNSALSVIQRNLEGQQRFVDQSHTSDNTFFSGMRLTDQTRASDEAQRNRAQALTDYQKAVGDLTAMLNQARGSRNESIWGANAADDEATAAAAAQAQAQAAEEARVAASQPAAVAPTGLFGRRPMQPSWYGLPRRRPLQPSWYS